MQRVCLLFLVPVFCFGQELKDYAAVIPSSAKTQGGVFRVHEVGATVYYEIPRSELGKPFLWWTRIARAPSMVGYGNEPVASQMVAWELRKNRVLLLRGTLDYPVADPNLEGGGALKLVIVGCPGGLFAIDSCPVIKFIAHSARLFRAEIELSPKRGAGLSRFPFRPHNALF